MNDDQNASDASEAPNAGKNLHVDEDWKAEAARAKENLQDSPGSTVDQEVGGADNLPEASFATLVAGLRAQAVIALGLMNDPLSNQPRPDRDQAKYVIDLLGVLEAKTAANLTDEEKALLDSVLYELRMSFVRM